MGHPYPGPWTWDHHPWLKDMHDSEAERNVGQKAAQMGFTELGLNIVFYTMDIKRMDCLYLLPNERPDAKDFSSGRFDRAVELSPHLTQIFSEIKNVGLKTAGNVNVYVRGMNSRSGLKGLPVSLIVFDELDEMDRENITLAEARSHGQIYRRDWKISTPSIHNDGINHYYLQTTQEHFFFPCPFCDRHIELKFPESLIITATDIDDPSLQESHLICYECKHKLPHEDKTEFLRNGFWVPQKPGRSIRGFHVPQLYSATMSPVDLADKYLRSQDDAVVEQEFYNSNLGQPHIVADAKIEEAEVRNCIADYVSVDRSATHNLVTMGIDVGRVCHVEIAEWFQKEKRYGIDPNMNMVPKVLLETTCDFPDLDKLMYNFQVKSAIIDFGPETRKALEFANKFPGYVHLCKYNHHSKARNISSMSTGDNTVLVNRTAWLDLSLGRFRTRDILLPKNVSKQYVEHAVAQVKVPYRDKNGEMVSVYKTPIGTHDHFGHARNYCEIALPFALGFGPTTNTESKV